MEVCKNCLCLTCLKYLPTGKDDCHICDVCTNGDCKKDKCESFVEE